MAFSTLQKVLIFALAAVSASPILLAPNFSAGICTAFVLLLGAGWFLPESRASRSAYRRGVLMAVLLLLNIQIGRFFFGGSSIQLSCEFAVLLLGAKCISRGSHGDDQQIVILSFLHLIGATVLTQNLSFAVAFALFLLFSPLLLTVIHLRGEMERRARASAASDAGDTLKRQLASGRIITPRFVWGSLLLSLPVLAVTAGLFVLFPRFGHSFFGYSQAATQSAGFSDQVRLSDPTPLLDDQEVVMRLVPHASSGPLPAFLPLRFRGGLLDTYEDSTWKRVGLDLWGRFRPLAGRFGLVVGEGRQPARELDILLTSLPSAVLFVPEGASALTFFREDQGGERRYRALFRHESGMLRYDNRSGAGIRYRASLDGAPPAGPDPRGQEGLLALPRESARLVELARTWAGPGASRLQAENLVAVLKTQYRYDSRAPDLEPGPRDGAQTPLDRFLFVRKRGTCEHFATALSLLLRAVGIPSRLATGFYGASWNPIGRFYSVQQKSAHAWVEAYLDGGWQTLDATGLPDAQDERTSSRIAWMLDAMRMHWHEYVLSYNADDQVEGARAAYRGLGDSLARLRRLLHSALVWGSALSALLVAFFLRAWQKQTGPGARPSSTALLSPSRVRVQSEATALYQKLDSALRRQCYPRPTSRTPLEHLAELERQGFPALPLAEEITRRYLEVRFGEGAFLPGEREGLKTELTRLGKNARVERRLIRRRTGDTGRRLGGG